VAKPLFEIPMAVASHEFAACWQAAGRHLHRQSELPLDWLRAHPNPPFLEHLSFRLGNQLFFIRIEDADQRVDMPGSRDGLLAVAAGCNGHPCIMPMRRTDGAWSPTCPAWGLIHARSGEPVHPPGLITSELIEMTDWELHDFAVQIVREGLVKEGRKLMTWVSNPGVDPTIWFHGDSGKEWVVVRAVRYPIRQPVVDVDVALEINQLDGTVQGIAHQLESLTEISSSLDELGHLLNDTRSDLRTLSALLLLIFAGIIGIIGTLRHWF
jgi:hypothetical protein